MSAPCETPDFPCSEAFTCCDCGGHGCGCRYCWSCNACPACMAED